MRGVVIAAMGLLIAGSSAAWGENEAPKATASENSAAGWNLVDERPSATDAGNLAALSISSGRYDRNGATVAALTDGQTVRNSDDPRRAFFFTGDGGRVVIDLQREVNVQQILTFSRHRGTRSAQGYTLWGGNASAENFNARPRRRADLAESGWTKIAEVDTRSADEPGKQVAVQVAAADSASLGSLQYLLFEMRPTIAGDSQSNTFYTEIDVLDGHEYEQPDRTEQVDSIRTDEGYELVFDTTAAPELRGWVDAKLKPVCREWYPKIVEMLPSEGFEPPRTFTIYFDNNMDGVAHTAGRDVYCAGVWFSRNLDGEAAGAVVHELVHVVQQYGRRRGNRNPAWMVEGVADYIRWFLYEPESQRPRPNFSRANFDDSYRTTGAFLNYVVQEHGEEIIPKFNAAMREGRYDEELWEEYTGKSPAELWKQYETSATGGE